MSKLTDSKMKVLGLKIPVIYVVIVAVLLSCFVCGGGGGITTLLNPKSEQTSEVSRPTKTPRPTNTPRPTATPKATKTPRPTATPKPAARPSREVSKEEFGKEWPFTVERGFVDCTTLPNGLRDAVFRADGVTYALNGTAQSRAEAQGYKDFSDIWRDDPDNPGLKINIGPILDLALQQCE